MAARLAVRFPGTTVAEDGLSVLCPALLLSGPEAKSLRLPALSVEVRPGSARVRESGTLTPAHAAAISLLWVDALGALPREPFLSFAFTALRHLEGYGGAYAERVLALHSELHPRSSAEVALAAPSGSRAGSAPPPPAATPAPARRPAEEHVSAQGLWSRSAHRAFEAALRAVLHGPSPPRVTDQRAWELVASAVALPGASAQACQRHFASLALLVRQWSCERGVAAAQATAPSPEPALPLPPAPLASAASGSKGGAFLGLLLSTTAPSPSAAASASGGQGGSEGEGEGEGGGGSEGEEGEGQEGEEGEEYEEEDEHGVISVQLRQPMLHGVVLAPPPLSAVSFLVDIKGLHLSGIGALVCSLVHLGVTCDRCGTLAHMPLPGAHIARSGCCPGPSVGGGGGSASGAGPAGAPGGSGGAAGDSASEPGEVRQWCTKCSNLLSCRLRAGLIHEGASSLGFVVALNCVAQVASCAELWSSCLECGEPHNIPRFTAPGSHEASCERCFARMKIDCREWEVDVRREGRQPAAPAAVKPGFTKYPTGRPLPGAGICEHFKQSHRWLRFPCCGLAFPCPVCHDCATTHPFDRAKRMLCGWCSREQPFSNAPCVACGEDMIKRAARTSHWEGGEGQRVRELLSSKDKHKYVGLTKSKSAKGTRVGTAKARAAASAALGRDVKERPGQ